MILNQFPSFFGGCGQTKRMDRFFVIAQSTDVLQPREHFRGALGQRGQSSL
jgi:hypothetical protein